MESNSQILQLCRLCLDKDSVNIPIFEEHDDIRQIYLKISSCLPVKVSRDDRLPKKICDGCSHKLDLVYEFRNTSVSAEKQLLEWLEDSNLISETVEKNIEINTQQNRPTETQVKQEEIDPSDIQKEEDEEDDKNYLFEQSFQDSSAAAGSSATNVDEEEEEPPPPKRAKRTAAVKAAIAMDQSDDDDEDYIGEPLTKVEDESEDSEGEDQETPFVDVPSTSADDQPGPSGVGKEGEAPCAAKRFNCVTLTNSVHYKRKYKKTKKIDKPKKHIFTPIEYVEPLQCNFCKDSSKTDFQFALHSIKHSKVCKYSCHLCNYETKSKYSLEDHMRGHEGSFKYRCEICEKTFRSGVQAKEHYNEHAGVIPYQCEVCGKHFTYSKRLAAHRRTSHYNVITGKSRAYTCSVCDTSYKFSSSLARHFKNKHTKFDQSVLCDICGRRLSCKDKLKYHLRLHTGQNTFNCLICHRKFAKKQQLACHMRTHTGEKPFICKYCGKGFSQSSPYRYHIKVHMGIRPHLCVKCGKGFIAKKSWRRHSSICNATTVKDEDEDLT